MRNLSNSFSSSLTCSALVSIVLFLIEDDALLIFFEFNVFFQPFFLSLKVSEPATLNSFTQQVIKDALFIPCDEANSWYDTSLDKYNSTTWNLNSKEYCSFFLDWNRPLSSKSFYVFTHLLSCESDPILYFFYKYGIPQAPDKYSRTTFFLNSKLYFTMKKPTS